ncbi:hypothetical protein JKG47_10045 [Acidithiobacillus sp. MC6.1]|nr:hypothetical protein [Acidithiobacillus sp. MC6.1]
MGTVTVVTVVDVSGLRLLDDVYEALSDHYEIRNSAYYRYYPDPSWNYLSPGVKSAVNAALISAGINIDVFQPMDFVLLHFSW